LETRRPWRLLPAVVSSAWHGVGQELSFWQHVSLSLFGQMSHLSGSVIKRQMLRGPKSHVCACIQVSTGEVVARSLSEHQANTTRHDRTMCNAIASWSNVIHEPPSPLVTYRFNAHCKPCPSQILHLLCPLPFSKAACQLETRAQLHSPEARSSQTAVIEATGSLEQSPQPPGLPAISSSA